MKTVSGNVLSSNPISLSKAAAILNNFASAENGASKSISAYIRRASAAFNDLNSFHKELKYASKSPRKKSKSKSNVTQENMQAGMSDTREEEPNQTAELSKEHIHGAGDGTERKKHKKKIEYGTGGIDNVVESKIRIEKLNQLPNEQNRGVDANTGVDGEGKKRKKNVVKHTGDVNGGLVEAGFVAVKTEIEVETEIQVKTEPLDLKADRKKRKSEVAKEGGEIASEEHQIKKKRRKN